MAAMEYNVTLDEYAALIGDDRGAFIEETFIQVSPNDTYVHNWHVDAILEHLAALEDGEIRRLLVTMPPRMMKSITITVGWPAWLLGRNPSNRIICASYGSDLALRQSIDTRLVMESDIYKMAFPHTRLANDQNQKNMFMTTERGFRKATSVGGQILGDGGDYLIGDDLIKADDATSVVARTTANAWLDQAFLPRLNNPATGKVVLVMQRLHFDDPAGHVMERGGWTHLNLPAEFHKKTIIDIRGKTWVKNEGDLLFPERLTPEVLEEKRKDLGTMAYNGQYLQQPTPPDGLEFKSEWRQRHEATNYRDMNIYIILDSANSKRKDRDPDYSTYVVMGLAPDNNYYLLDIVRDRLNPTERVDTLIELHKKWNARTGKPPKVGVEQYGLMTDAYYISRAQNAMNYRFPLIELGGKMNKEDRIRRMIPLFEKGQVYMPKYLAYTQRDGTYVDLVRETDNELNTFPLGRHDDIIDAMARIVDEKLGAVFPKPQQTRGVYEYKSTARDFDPNNMLTW